KLIMHVINHIQADIYQQNTPLTTCRPREENEPRPRQLTVAEDRVKLQANVARFQRAPLYNNVRSAPIKDDRIRRDVNKPEANGGSSVSGKTFATAVKNNFNHINVEKDDSPTIVLDDECITDRDLSKSLLGRVKVFSSLPNLKVALNNEGFVDMKVKYMGELWVLMEFNSVKSKDLFCDNVGVWSWFAELVPARIDFNPEGRILWVEVEGVPFKFWSQRTFYKIAAKWGELLEMDDPDENCYHSRRLCVYTKVHSNVFENFKLTFQEDKEADNGDMEDVPDTVFVNSTRQKENGSEDPFGIYSILNRNTMRKNDNGDVGTLSYPSGFTSNDDVDLGNEVNEENCDVDEGNKGERSGESGQTMGYNMGNVVLMGDFNEVRYKSDRFGSTFNVQGAIEFNYFINDADLEEVPLGGSMFTWCHKSGLKMSKLDRFFISNSLFNSSPHTSAITLERYLSDHRPILLRETNYDYGPIPFWFFHHWFELDGFNKFVIDSWNVVPGDVSNGMLNLVYKLKYLKVRIREWIKDYRRKCNGAMDRYKEELRVLDEAVDKGQGSDLIVNKRVEIINNIFRLEHLHSMDMAQKAKPRDVKREFFSHFRDRFAKSPDQRILINMEFPNSISSEQQADLERLVSREELKTAVWNCGTDKSPGPDGFTFGFYRQFWSTIENDVFDVVNHFFSCGDIPKGCNSSFIVLVGVLGVIVSKVQSAFIADRQILDGPFILNEVIQWCKSKKKQSLIFKVDFEKAYDSVRWDFLDDVLKKFGFRTKWCNWIHTCLKSSRGSILINGSPTEEFQCFRGLKQGDPLSPFLFILVMESLHLSFQRVVEAGLFTSLFLSKSLKFSHMFYADDAIFVGQWSDENINTLVRVLDCFHRASGLKINMNKSKIMGIHMEGNKVEQAVAKLGCLILTLPFSYLGTKVGGSMSRIQAWKEVWTRSRLVYQVPSKVLHELESLRGHFFNGHEAGSNKASWVKWDSVLVDKDRGLGVKVIQAIHGDDGNVSMKNKFVVNSCWSYIIKEVRLLADLGVDMFEFLKLRLGNGERIKFWSDSWFSGGVLKDICPQGAEMAQFQVFHEVIKTVKLVPMEDRWVWNLDNSSLFTVSSLRKKIDAKRLARVAEATRWIKFVLIKVNVLAWKVMIDALPTRLNISHRGIGIPSLSCPICDCGVESTDHLFFRCTLVKQLGHKVLTWWNLPVAEFDSYIAWKSWLSSIRVSSKIKLVLEEVWSVMWWFVWNHRNKILFDVTPPRSRCYLT
nr:putative RNA-directed DNA polymerase, eukaryota, reverse transcriptase zinc-binding domain protein [Tanacetum cinerariifolium]